MYVSQCFNRLKSSLKKNQLGLFRVQVMLKKLKSVASLQVVWHKGHNRIYFRSDILERLTSLYDAI